MVLNSIILSLSFGFSRTPTGGVKTLKTLYLTLSSHTLTLTLSLSLSLSVKFFLISSYRNPNISISVSLRLCPQFPDYLQHCPRLYSLFCLCAYLKSHSDQNQNPPSHKIKQRVFGFWFGTLSLSVLCFHKSGPAEQSRARARARARAESLHQQRAHTPKKRYVKLFPFFL